jgi:hypothetical protein
MGKVSWSDQAVADLERVEDPTVREQLRRNAEKILQHSPARTSSADEGFEGGVMWRRGATPEQELQANAGWLSETPESPQAWDYFLFYRQRELDRGFEVLAVRSTRQVASRWLQMVKEPGQAHESLADQAAYGTVAAAPKAKFGDVTLGRRPADRNQTVDREAYGGIGRVAVAGPTETLKKGTRVTSVDRSKLATSLGKRYDSGESIRSLAASTGRSYGFVHRILTETGITLRGRGGATRYGKTKVRWPNK